MQQAELLPPSPGIRKIYKKSEEQPPSDGYFPIINCDIENKVY